MNPNSEELIELVEPIFDLYQEQIQPATEEQIIQFVSQSERIGLPEELIKELVDFYQLINGIPRAIFSLDEGAPFFEWWEDREVWLGQVDMDTIRWKDGKYHLGSASDLNYGPEYVSNDIYGILKIGIKDWYADDPNIG